MIEKEIIQLAISGFALVGVLSSVIVSLWIVLSDD